MYAARKNVTAFVTPTFKRSIGVLSALALGLLLVFGGAVGARANLMDEILQGIEDQIQVIPKTALHGDVTNYTEYEAYVGIFVQTKEPTDPIYKAWVLPGETAYFDLVPGNYVLAAVVYIDGKIHPFVHKFRLTPDGGDFGFDLRLKDEGLEA